MLSVIHANGDCARNTYGHEFTDDELQEAIDYLVAHRDERYESDDFAGRIEFEDDTFLIVTFSGRVVFGW